MLSLVPYITPPIEHINTCRYKGGPEITRKVIFDNLHKTYIVDVYPLCLKLIDGRDNSEKVFRISRKVKCHYFTSLFDSVIKLSIYNNETILIYF